MRLPAVTPGIQACSCGRSLSAPSRRRRYLCVFVVEMSLSLSSEPVGPGLVKGTRFEQRSPKEIHRIDSTCADARRGLLTNNPDVMSREDHLPHERKPFS